MPMTTIRQITAAIQRLAPLDLQESWDNSGLQVGNADAVCTGVLVTVDVTPAVVREAVARGCNLIVSHHPLIFRGLKTITGQNDVQLSVHAAIVGGVSVYSSHTALDNAPGGVSHTMASMLGVRVTDVLVPSAPGSQAGTGVVGELPQPLGGPEFVSRVKKVFGASVARCTAMPAKAVSRVALCGGAGGEFIARAAACGAQAYVTGDVRYHDFVDWQDRLLIVDVGHYETEQCVKNIFFKTIQTNFPELPLFMTTASNPVHYC